MHQERTVFKSNLDALVSELTTEKNSNAEKERLIEQFKNNLGMSDGEKHTLQLEITAKTSAYTSQLKSMETVLSDALKLVALKEEKIIECTELINKLETTKDQISSDYEKAVKESDLQIKQLSAHLAIEKQVNESKDKTIKE